MTPPHVFDPTDAYLREGTHSRLYERSAATSPGVRRRRRLRGVGAQRAAVSVIGDWNGWQADADPLQRARRRQRHLGRRRARRARAAHAYKYRIVSAHGGYVARKGRPVRVLRRAAAGHRVAHLVARVRVERRRLDGAARRRRNALDAPMSIYEVHLGSWRRKDGAVARLPRAGARAGRLRGRHGLHPRRADADHRASVLRLVGLPDHRLLRADRALRHAAGLHVLRRPPAPARHRRAARLGALALSRPTRTAWRYFDGTHLYEHADPRQGFHPEWNSRHLQLRPPRGAQLPDLVGAVLARPLPHRRPARRRGGLDAVPRLRAQARRVDPQPLRRPREPRGDRVPARAQPRGVPRAPRHHDDRRGIDRLADGLAADRHRRPGLRHEVEHGLDARHAGVHAGRPGPPPAITTTS